MGVNMEMIKTGGNFLSLADYGLLVALGVRTPHFS